MWPGRSFGEFTMSHSHARQPHVPPPLRSIASRCMCSRKLPAYRSLPQPSTVLSHVGLCAVCELANDVSLCRTCGRVGRMLHMRTHFAEEHMCEWLSGTTCLIGRSLQGTATAGALQAMLTPWLPELPENNNNSEPRQWLLLESRHDYTRYIESKLRQLTRCVCGFSDASIEELLRHARKRHYARPVGRHRDRGREIPACPDSEHGPGMMVGGFCRQCLKRHKGLWDCAYCGETGIHHPELHFACHLGPEHSRPECKLCGIRCAPAWTMK